MACRRINFFGRLGFLIEEECEVRSLHCVIQVGVVLHEENMNKALFDVDEIYHNDQGRLPAQLQRDALQVRRPCRLLDDVAHSRGTGEGNLGKHQLKLIHEQNINNSTIL